MIILTIPILLATLNGKNSYYYCNSNSDHTHTQKNGVYIYIYVMTGWWFQPL